MIFEPIVASTCIALLSLIGVFFFGKKGHLTGTHRFILPTAIGVFLGVIFFELIPETLEAAPLWGPATIIIGFLGFYLLSFILDTYHHHHIDHTDTCGTNGAKKLLIGDAVHNFADGIVIATAFMIDPSIGVITAIGIALHEIPQEIAEFGVLIHSGCTRSKAALYNLFSASTVILGTFATLLFSEVLGSYVFVLTGIAAGNLLYIATADLLPELKENHRHHFVQTFIATLIGVVSIAALITYTHEFIGHHDDEHAYEEEHAEEYEDEAIHTD